MRIKVVYHNDCIDGFSAALAASVGLSVSGEDMKEVALAPLQYGTPVDDKFITNEELSTLQKIYFIDICPTKLELENLSKRCSHHFVDVVVLDHHKTAIDEFGETGAEYKVVLPRVSMMLDNTRSGALLSYDVFLRSTSFPSAAEEFFKLVSDRDLWKENDDARALTSALGAEMRDIPHWISLLVGFINDPEDLLIKGDAIIQRDQRLCEEIAKKFLIVEIGGHKVPMVFAPKSLSSDVGNLLANRYPEYPFAASVEMGAETVSVSLRSNGFDVETIAKGYNGGGHLRASGLKLKLADFFKIIS